MMDEESRRRIALHVLRLRDILQEVGSSKISSEWTEDRLVELAMQRERDNEISESGDWTEEPSCDEDVPEAIDLKFSAGPGKPIEAERAD